MKEDEYYLPDHIRKVFQDVEISSEQLKITLNELTSLVRHCYDIDSYFPNIIGKSNDKQNSALLEPEVLNQLLHYLQEDEKQSAEFSNEKHVSEKETYLLQYLAGYLFCNLYEKIKMAEKKYE